MRNVLCQTLSKAFSAFNQLISDRWRFLSVWLSSRASTFVYLTYQWAVTVESKGEALAVILNAEKAFDRVWHSTFLSKITLYELSKLLRLDNQFTHGSICGNAGASQGCVLSTTLFLDLSQISVLCGWYWWQYGWLFYIPAVQIFLTNTGSSTGPNLCLVLYSSRDFVQ